MNLKSFIKPNEETQSWLGYLKTAANKPRILFAQVELQRPFAEFHFPFSGLRHICAVVNIEQTTRVYLVSEEGILYIYDLDTNEGGDCTLVKTLKLLDSNESCIHQTKETREASVDYHLDSNKRDDSQTKETRGASVDSPSKQRPFQLSKRQATGGCPENPAKKSCMITDKTESRPHHSKFCIPWNHPDEDNIILSQYSLVTLCHSPDFEEIKKLCYQLQGTSTENLSTLREASRLFVKECTELIECQLYIGSSIFASAFSHDLEIAKSKAYNYGLELLRNLDKSPFKTFDDIKKELENWKSNKYISDQSWNMLESSNLETKLELLNSHLTEMRNAEYNDLYLILLMSENLLKSQSATLQNKNTFESICEAAEKANCSEYVKFINLGEEFDFTKNCLVYHCDFLLKNILICTGTASEIDLAVSEASNKGYEVILKLIGVSCNISEHKIQKSQINDRLLSNSIDHQFLLFFYDETQFQDPVRLLYYAARKSQKNINHIMSLTNYEISRPSRDIYRCITTLDNEEIGTGSGFSKKLAKRSSAERAVLYLKQNFYAVKVKSAKKPTTQDCELNQNRRASGTTARLATVGEILDDLVKASGSTEDFQLVDMSYSI